MASKTAGEAFADLGAAVSNMASAIGAIGDREAQKAGYRDLDDYRMEQRAKQHLEQVGRLPWWKRRWYWAVG
jgi:hypothetical protein